MSASRPDNEVIFHAAREIPDPDRRREYVREACDGDETRIAHIESLLTAADSPDSLLDRPAAELAAGATAAEAQHGDFEWSLDFLAPSEKPGSLGCLGHYEIQETIGRGGMGVVLRAFDEKLHRVVAIKVMAAPLATNATARKRFTREAQAQAAVSHDHIVTIHAVEEANGLPYLVMQYISGMSLQERIDKSGPMQLHEILRIGMQAASGLAAAHAQGLVHRDIKPANILLENGVERVKITDFGLARAATEASLTQSGIVAGTPQYMSPEQAEGKSIDQRTDLFSLGSMLYTMCTGRAPFRASGSMAVLKRVCEVAPTPIRETNPDIPDWLIAIIDQLHAKDPANRYQSAAELAELLGRHLAHVQHPSVVGPASNVPAVPVARSIATPRRRRLAVAAAALLCFVVGISLTEATGVTNVRGTVVRILMPDGTLVVETDDSGIKVKVEGDGGLLITGAGLEEIRLRPGSYKVHADRDGKKVLLDRELVSISKGGREVVRVKLVAAPAPPAGRNEKGAFVVLGGNGVVEQKLDALAEAVVGASDGDIIEVRGNGPFVSDGLIIKQSLVIRAGTGYTPLIRLSDAAASRNMPLINASVSLVLEGLDLRTEGQSPSPIEGRYAILLNAFGGASLHVANCRFVSDGLIIASGNSVFNVRNCQLNSSRRAGLDWYPPPGGRCTLENSAIAAGGLSLVLQKPGVSDIGIGIRDNTIIGYGLSMRRRPELLPNPGEPALVRWEFSRNVALNTPAFGQSGILYYQDNLEKPLPAEDAEELIPKLMSLREQSNVYQSKLPLLQLKHDKSPRKGARGQNLADWNKFWGQHDTGSSEGDIHFDGGNLIVRSRTARETLASADFRLRPDSAGYRAGKDGKDLGVDVDLVGPGPAYERWKKTPEYQHWLKETGQVKK